MTVTQETLDDRITIALERFYQALRVMLWQKTNQYQLSPIQIQIISFIYTHHYQQIGINTLANHFGVKPPTISDAIRVLIKKGLIQKHRAQKDQRHFVITLTEQGSKIAREVVFWLQPLHGFLQERPESEKKTVYWFILDLLKFLTDMEMISWSRMCFHCRYYQPEAADDHDRFYCQFLKQYLPRENLQIDCPDFQPFT